MTGDSSDAVVFGSEAWRMPRTIDFLQFARDAILAASQDGAVVRFARDGARTVIAEGMVESASDIAMRGTNAVVFAGPQPTVVDLATRAVSAFEQGVVTRLAIDHDRAVVGAADSPLAVVDIGSRARLVELAQSRHYEEPTIVGSWVIAGRYQRSVSVSIWDLATGARHRIFALGNTSLFALSPDHQWMVTGTFQGTPSWAVDVYRVDDGKRMATIGFECNPGSAAISEDSKLLAIACDDELRIVRLPDGERVASMRIVCAMAARSPPESAPAKREFFRVSAARTWRRSTMLSSGRPVGARVQSWRCRLVQAQGADAMKR